jgi:hypothetical protein
VAKLVLGNHSAVQVRTPSAKNHVVGWERGRDASDGEQRTSSSDTGLKPGAAYSLDPGGDLARALKIAALVTLPVWAT